MDAGPLDVLEEARDQHELAIGDGVDVDLHALEVAIDADRTIGVHDRRGGQLAGQVRRRIAEVDGQATDDERRPDDDRVADPLGKRQRLLDRVRHAAVRLGDAEPVEQRREPRPLLRLVDRLEARAEQRDTAGGQRRGQVERRLAAVGDDGRQEVAIGERFGIDHVPDALRIERLEIQPGAGVEVGRDRLRVGVDHDRAPTGPPERVGGLDRAVVELDPLPDPHRPRADDERRRPRDRRCLRAPSRPPRRSSRSTASRPRTRPRRCRPSRSRGADRAPAAPPGSRRRSCQPGRPARGRRSRLA